jgi:hypothetical protein
MSRPRPYGVTHQNTTPDEPSPGVYWGYEGPDGERVLCGPYRTRDDANDAIDEWLAQKETA